MARYKNAGGQPREKCMIAAYALVTRYGASQEAVADAMRCSQGTISYWCKEMRFKEEIQGLKQELAAAHDLTQELADQLHVIEYDPSSY